jgi:ribosomal protein L44E
MAPKVAKDIVSYCTSCRMDLVHTIVAVQGNKVVRVLCRTCKKEHAYRVPEEQRAFASRKRVAKDPAPGKARSTAEWEAAMERMRGHAANPYALDGSYEAGEKVDHPVFGTGMVRKLISPDKMEVLFEQGGKLLVRGNARKTSV